MVQEHPPLAPSFEIFGAHAGYFTGPMLFAGLPGMVFQPAPMAPRYWFMSPEGNHLIQFQADRLLHNWRKAGEGDVYPRYEHIIDVFENEAARLAGFFSKTFSWVLVCSQVEITYINSIPLVLDGTISPPDHWVRFAPTSSPELEDFGGNFREVILNTDGNPVGRLICDFSVTQDPARGRLLNFGLTVRGRPETPDIEGARRFFDAGRERIVRRFTQLTTEAAHLAWERRT